MCSVFQVKVQMHWESSGRCSETFKDLPLFLFSGIFALSCAAAGAIHYCVKVLVLLWPGSIVKQLVFIAVGERQDDVSSPLPLQMCLDQGKLTMCFVFFKTLM